MPNLLKISANLLVLSLILTSCLPFSSKLIGLDVRVEKEYLQGAYFNIPIEITNQSLSLIALKKIEIPEIKDTTYDFSKTPGHLRYGEISYQKDQDIFIHDQFSQREAFLPSGFLYNKGLLFPGETKIISIQAQSLHAGKIKSEVIVTFQRLKSDLALSDLYIPDLQTITPQEIQYRHPTEKEIQDWEESKETFDTVIIKIGDEDDDVFTVKMKTTITPLEFGIDQATQTLGKVGEYWYSPDLKKWAVETQEGVYLIDRYQTDFLPGINLFTLKGIDEELPISVYDELFKELRLLLDPLRKELPTKGPGDDGEDLPPQSPWGVITLPLEKQQTMELVSGLYGQGYTLVVGEHFLSPSLIIQPLPEPEEIMVAEETMPVEETQPLEETQPDLDPDSSDNEVLDE